MSFRIRFRPVILILGILFTGAGLATASILGVAPDRPTLEGAELSEKACFARIDSLKALRPEAEGPAEAEILQRLAELWLSLEMPKHRRHALDLLEEAEAAGGDSHELQRRRIAAAQQMRYRGQAGRWIEKLVEESAETLEALLLAGQFELYESRFRLDARRLQKAGRHYWNASRADSTSGQAWYGLACTRLIRNRPAAALEALERVEGMDALALKADLLAGAALASLGRNAEADPRFRRALNGFGSELRQTFMEGGDFISEKALAKIARTQMSSQDLEAAMHAVKPGYLPGDRFEDKYLVQHAPLRQEALRRWWQSRRPDPTQLLNASQLEFWRRMVLADLIFGDEESGKFGWESTTGAIWVRRGRPDQMRYQAGSSDTLTPLLAMGFVLQNHDLPNNTAAWVWAWQRGHDQDVAIFLDPTRNDLWVLNSQTSWETEALARDVGVSFPMPIVAPQVHLAWSHSLFYRGPHLGTLENSIFISPLGPYIPLEIRLAVIDPDGVRLHYHESSLPAPGMPRLPLWVRQELPPGRYLMALSIRTPAGATRAWTRPIDIPLGPPPGLLELSELQLASAFAPSGLDGFQKYDRSVMALAGLVLPEGLQTLHVYYELYNPRVDEEELTRFGVRYEIYKATRELRGNLAQGFDPSGLEGLDALRVEFVEERTGRSSLGHVVKGGDVEVGSLPDGRYLLVVTLEDQLAGETVSRAALFIKDSASLRNQGLAPSAGPH